MYQTAHNNHAGMMAGGAMASSTTNNTNPTTEQQQAFSSQPMMQRVANPIPHHNYHSTNSYQTPMLAHNQPPTPSKSNTSQGLIQAPTAVGQQDNVQQQYIQQPMAQSSPGKINNYAYYSAPNQPMSGNVASSTNQHPPQYSAMDNYGNQPGYNSTVQQPVNNQPEVQNAPNIEEVRTKVVPDEPQLIFSCKHCRTIFIDSNALFFNGEEHGIITFLKVHKVEAREHVQIAPNDRFDAGSNYYPLFCKQCQTLVGRKYLMSDRSPIVDIIGLYTLDIDALSLYELWTAEQESGNPGEFYGGRGHVDNVKSIPTNRAIMQEITLLKKAMLVLQEDQSKQLTRLGVLDKLNDFVENNDSIKKIPDIVHRIGSIERIISESTKEQQRLAHINRRLGNEVTHIKKETGIPLLGMEQQTISVSTPPPPTNTTSTKKRTSTSSSTTALVEQQTSHTPETTNPKKRKTVK